MVFVFLSFFFSLLNLNSLTRDMQGQCGLADCIKRTIEIWHFIYREGDIFSTVATLWQDVACFALKIIPCNCSNAIILVEL